MAQGQLTAAAACAVILAAGVAAEVAGPDPAALPSVADLAVGAAFAGCGLWLVAAGRSWGWLGLVTAAAWFTGTAAGAAPWLPAYLGNVAALGYRAFLLHLLACALGLPLASTYRPLILAVLLPVPADSLATAALMAGLAALAAMAARRTPADRRRAIVAVCLSAAALAVIWSLAAAGITGGTGAELANDLALVATAFVLAAGWARGGWLQGAISALVVELGPSQHPAAPVSALLANALADPELDVRYSVPGLGWFDENGLRVTAPSGEGAGPLTRVATPDGGEVVLVHGPAAAAGPALARAAATAAALAMESARLGAEVRQQADAVRESRRRLLAVADAERQALETRLRAGPAGCNGSTRRWPGSATRPRTRSVARPRSRWMTSSGSRAGCTPARLARSRSGRSCAISPRPCPCRCGSSLTASSRPCRRRIRRWRISSVPNASPMWPGTPVRPAPQCGCTWTASGW